MDSLGFFAIYSAVIWHLNGDLVNVLFNDDLRLFGGSFEIFIFIC